LRRYIPAELLNKLEFASESGGMEGERRTVTMLFCDLQGSTAAAEQMDPEEWADVMNGAFEHLIAPVYRYEGTLARLMGDAILAFFGAPIGHEDDPERAIRAGQEILEAIGPYKEQVKRDWGIDIDVRVGINTGLVVVGAIGSDLRVEYTAMGDAVNTAARMESTARPGTIQVSADTQRLVDKLFEFEDLGGVEVKGKAEPVLAYRVVKALPRPETIRGIEGLRSPLVGRDGELKRLQDVIEATSTGKGGIVSVMAEAGLGKSRLVSEVRSIVLGDFANLQWHEGRSLSYETATPYASARRIVRSICRLTGGESPAEVWRRIDETVGRVAPGRVGAIAPFLAWVLEASPPQEHAQRLEYLDPPQLRAEAFRSIVEIINAIATNEPIVLVFEDLHWADPASLDLVRELLATASTTRLVLLLVFRPRRQEGSWEIHELAGRDFVHAYTEIALQPLPDGETRDLVSHLLAVDGLPDGVRSEILSKSEGNPFFVEEIIRSLIDRDLVVHDGEKWTATEEVAIATVPENLAAVLTTRLDALDERSRRIAQAASVVGRQFRYDELAACLPDLSGMEEGLVDLQRRELIVEVARIPKRLFRFRHALLQDATYETVLLKQRTRLHASVADFIERTQPERVEDLAEHLVRAREGARAVPYLVAAGEKAARSYAIQTAIDRLDTALEHMNDESPSDLMQRALEALGQAHQFRFDMIGAAEAYRRLGAEGEQRDDAGMKISSLNKLGLVRALFFDERDDGLDDIQTAEAMARDLDEGEGLIESCINQCYVRTAHAEFDKVAYYMGEVTSLGSELGASDPTLFGMSHLANTLLYLTQFDEALEQAEKTLAKAEELGNLKYQADMLAFALPLCHMRNGDMTAATAAVERGMEIAQRIGARDAEAFAAMVQGKLAMEQGFLEEALGLFRRTIEASDATGVPYVMALGRCVTGTCYLHIGGPMTERALELHRETLEVMEQPTGSTLGAMLWTEIGQCVLATGEVEEARRLFERALTEQTAPMYLQRPGALAGTIDIALIEGDLETARLRLAELDEYVTARDMKDQVPLVMYTKARVAAGAGEHEDALATLDSLAEAAASFGMRRILLDVHAARAASLDALSRPDEASEARAAVRDVAGGMAGDITDDSIREAFLEGLETRLG
jgi:class 3 adenylate cyclase/tetratricopeptide (TPR) repeat protein